MIENEWEYRDLSRWQIPDSIDVLIVEDDKTTSRLIKAIANRTQSNLRIKTFTSAESALEYLEGIHECLHKTPDLAIVDLYLKGPKNGLEVCKWLNDHSKETSIVVTSSLHPELFHRMTKRMEDAPLFLPKPFTIRQMSSLFERLS